MTEQHGHFGVSHVLDVTSQVVAERRVGGDGVHVAGDREFAGQRQVFGADSQRPHAGFGTPCVGCRVEMAEGVAVEFDAHGFGFVCVELNLGKAFELAGRA